MILDILSYFFLGFCFGVIIILWICYKPKNKHPKYMNEYYNEPKPNYHQITTHEIIRRTESA